MVQNKLSAEYTRAGVACAAPSLSDVAIIGIYEISKILTGPNRLETALASVVNVLSSFLQMRHGVIALLADDGIPDITVGAGWSEGTDERYRARLPQKVVGQIIATAVPLVVQNVASHSLFAPADAEALGASAERRVSFIGVPIRVERRVVGTLTIDRVWDGGSVFRLDSDVRFLTMVGNLIGQAVQLYRVVSRDRDRLMAESHRLQKALSDRKPVREQDRAKIQGIIGDSPALRLLTGRVAVVAKSNAPVLIRGESGTGKELIAKAIHELSPRAAGPFIKLNCAALPESVLESELFGHEKGAFTGAINTRKGRFELADKGTLFLDEIGEISLSFQAKLLRVLQEHEFERVGGNRTIKVNVRIVAATNKDLERAVARNEFRADLYYRISVVPMIVPPLRDRPGDIPLLACEFLKRFNTENDRTLTLSPGAINVLTGCYFPGNVRELENCVQRTATLAEGQQIVADDFACRHNECLSSVLWKGHSELPSPLPPPEVPLPVLPAAPVVKSPDHQPAVVDKASPGSAGAASAEDSSERARLIDAMERAGWVQAKAARLLGLTARQIGYALKKHTITIKHF
ncbi:MAG TPA: nif-specific transcriptional activator NifA [Methylocella sp.]|nr:nif-specific transcriptional activator NifA [Methylocella sp.]